MDPVFEFRHQGTQNNLSGGAFDTNWRMVIRHSTEHKIGQSHREKTDME